MNAPSKKIFDDASLLAYMRKIIFFCEKDLGLTTLEAAAVIKTMAHVIETSMLEAALDEDRDKKRDN